MASRMFARASSSVAPCDQHPGSPGQETLYPSSVGTRATGYFMSPTVAESPERRLATDERENADKQGRGKRFGRWFYPCLSTFIRGH